MSRASPTPVDPRVCKRGESSYAPRHARSSRRPVRRGSTSGDAARPERDLVDEATRAHGGPIGMRIVLPTFGPWPTVTSLSPPGVLASATGRCRPRNLYRVHGTTTVRADLRACRAVSLRPTDRVPRGSWCPWRPIPHIAVTRSWRHTAVWPPIVTAIRPHPHRAVWPSRGTTRRRGPLQGDGCRGVA